MPFSLDRLYSRTNLHNLLCYNPHCSWRSLMLLSSDFHGKIVSPAAIFIIQYRVAKFRFYTFQHRPASAHFDKKLNDHLISFTFAEFCSQNHAHDCNAFPTDSRSNLQNAFSAFCYELHYCWRSLMLLLSSDVHGKIVIPAAIFISNKGCQREFLTSDHQQPLKIYYSNVS